MTADRMGLVILRTPDRIWRWHPEHHWVAHRPCGSRTRWTKLANTRESQPRWYWTSYETRDQAVIAACMAEQDLITGAAEGDLTFLDALQAAGLSRIPYNILFREGIRTAEELSKLRVIDLADIRNMGRVRIREVRDAFAKIGGSLVPSEWAAWVDQEDPS
jgi:DNA-directed RNA polymerase alpha subunit